MRILAVSDLHGNHDIYKWIMSAVDRAQVDALILAGDLLGYAEGFDSVEEAQRADSVIVTSILKDISIPIYYIMGNDDEVEIDSPNERFCSIHGKRIDSGPFNFVGYQNTLPFMGGVHERPEEVIASDLAKLESLMDENTVLVTHGPAYGILDKTQLGPAGSPSLLDTINRRNVRLHIHGHTHSSFGRSGRHFNVASGGHKKRAVIIDVATMKHEILESV